MAGVKALRRIQYGQESTATAGTAVAATGKLRMNGTMQDDREMVWAEEEVGILGGMDRVYCPKLGATFELEGEATYEQLPIIFGASILETTGVKDGAGSGYVYTFTRPTTAKNTIFTYTLEGGDDQAAEEMEYAYCEEWTLSGKYGESMMISSTWKGRQCTTSTFTADTDAPVYAVEEVLFGKGKLYIDADTDTIGTTLKSNTLMEVELKYTSGWIPKYTADGNLYFSRIENVGEEVELSITFEHDTVGVAEKDAWRLKSGRAIRLIWTGNAVTTGTAYSFKTLKIDLYGKWETFEKIDEIDGNDVVKGTMKCRYSTNAATKGSIIVVNERTTF